MSDSRVARNFDQNFTDRPKQERSVVTRAQLMEAARKIFVRDGFERARLEDISAMAGKTRGAFYAHFQDKEDVFFAIFEEDIARGRRELASELTRNSSKEERFEALVAHIMAVLADRECMLLNLEFKMYALRHPAEHQRLSNLHAAICQRGSDREYKELFPEFDTTRVQARKQAAQLGALIDGLALNRFFDPLGLDEETLLRQVQNGVRAILF